MLREALAEEAAFDQRAFLLKEVNQRVKNPSNWRTRFWSPAHKQGDPDTRGVLRHAIDRLDRLSRVQQMLYTSEFERIGFRAYVERLCVDLVAAMELKSGDVHLDLDLADAVWGADLVIPLALIVNEAITNAWLQGGEREGHGPHHRKRPRKAHHALRQAQGPSL